MTEPAVFVSSAVALQNSPGGLQICTKEFLETIRGAGFEPTVVDFQSRRNLGARIRRKWRPNPYRNALPDDLLQRVAGAAVTRKARWIFFNLTALTPLAKPLKRLIPGVKIAVLSHGAESVDFFHSLRIKAACKNRPATIRERLSLADQLMEEADSRPYVDHVFVLAPFEAEYERWLGARRVTWVPRQVPRSPLTWRPVEGRIGFVATLEHWPTIEALDLFLPELANHAGKNVRLRLVGGPEAEGRAIQSQFAFVEFLGYLDDAALRQEAKTWTCYPQPLFCWGRGCSTKLATALSWGVPVVTTPQGVRGYQWRSGGVVMAETPAEVAVKSIRLALDEPFRRSAKQAVDDAAASTPTLDDVSILFRSALDAA